MPDGYERFSERSDVLRARNEINMGIEALNDSLSFTSEDYDGVISFAHESGDALAIPLADTNAYNIAPERYEFRSNNIVGRRLLLAGTALGRALRNGHGPDFTQSTIHPSIQQTYIHPLVHDERGVGALQYSFTAAYPSTPIPVTPEQKEMEDFHKAYQREIDHIAAQTARLQNLAHETKGTKSLATGLEMEQPVAPNAYIIRWDIRGSSHFVNSDLGPVYDAFVGQVHARLHELVLSYSERYEYLKAGVHEAYDDQGDGAYIVLPLPHYVNPYERRALVDFQQRHVEDFMKDFRADVESIGYQYRKTFVPKVAITADFGYVEENTIDRLTSRTMHTLANRQKEK